MHQKTSVLEYFLSVKLQNKDLCFAVNFAKFLTKPNLWNICEGTSYLCENTYHMDLLVTVYLAKKRSS